jgi:predicted NBD/HSP70 family sugar kinase
VAATSSEADQGVAETAWHIGIGIANLINLISPGRIVLSGWAGPLLGERLLPGICESARRHSLSHPFVDASIGLGRLGPDAVGLRAATLPIEQFLNGTARSR